MLKYIICMVVHLPVDNEIVHYTNNVMKNWTKHDFTSLFYVITASDEQTCY